jgi:hypothetical protein
VRARRGEAEDNSTAIDREIEELIRRAFPDDDVDPMP